MHFEDIADIRCEVKRETRGAENLSKDQLELIGKFQEVVSLIKEEEEKEEEYGQDFNQKIERSTGQHDAEGEKEDERKEQQ